VKWRGLARRAIPYVVSATSGFLLAYLLVAMFIFPAKLISGDTKVPNVVGLSYGDASKRLSTAGFVVVKGGQRYHSSAPSGLVLGQNPLPDATAPKGSRVVLDVSRGQPRGEVPMLVGLTRPQAELALQSAGLAVGEVTEVRNSSPRGQVLSSYPPEGSRVPVPSAVKLRVSSGPPTVNVPDVTVQGYAEARSLLGQLGFVVGTVTVDSSGRFPPNTVIAQSPAAGRPVAAGSTINLTIAGSP
jgi:beta-lactam-binding protein with PASTA domain